MDALGEDLKIRLAVEKECDRLKGRGYILDFARRRPDELGELIGLESR